MTTDDFIYVLSYVVNDVLFVSSTGGFTVWAVLFLTVVSLAHFIGRVWRSE